MLCKDVIYYLEEISPIYYAMEWDNVGLIVGRGERDVNSILIALDATTNVIKEATKYDMLITHHPLIFSKINKINSNNVLGNKILELIENNVSYYAMHTNFDVCGGMSEAVANKLNFDNYKVLEDTIDGKGVGIIGSFSEKLNNQQICDLIKQKFDLKNVIMYGENTIVPDVIGISPGSGKSVISSAVSKGVNCLITGDIGHHDAIDAMEMGMTIIDTTHYGLEIIFEEFICELLSNKFPDIKIKKYNSTPPMQIV